MSKDTGIADQTIRNWISKVDNGILRDDVRLGPRQLSPIIEITADDADQFAWGIMMYPETLGTQEFNMVTYWVDE